MNYKAYVPFLSRLAVLCNICFLIDMAIMYIPGWHMPNFLANFFGVLGLEMAPFVNLLLGMLFLIVLSKKIDLDLRKWQTFFNMSMLLIQLFTLFA
jgi:hypothetical protein